MNIVHISNYSKYKQTMTIMRRIYLQKLMAADHLLKLLLTTGFIGFNNDFWAVLNDLLWWHVLL